MPLILVYAANAVIHWKEIWQQRRRWPFWLACGFCAVFVAGWLWTMIVVDPDRILHLLRPAA